MNRAAITFIGGALGKGVRVEIFNTKNVCQFHHIYWLGYDCAATRYSSTMAARLYSSSKKHEDPIICNNCLKPFIGDIIADLFETYYINTDAITYLGFTIAENDSASFRGYTILQTLEEMNDTELNELKKSIIDSY